MLLNQSSLDAIHHFCTANRTLLEQSASAGCLCCGATFTPSEILEWVPQLDPVTQQSVGETASCPKCGIDSVLPSAAPVSLNPHMLAAMQSFWFGSARSTTPN